MSEQGTQPRLAPAGLFREGSGLSQFECAEQCQRVGITTPGTNVQLYQDSLALEANTRYRLTFWAYSNTGDGMQVVLLKNVTPFINYGMKQVFGLTNTWQPYAVEFITSGFAGTVNDGRLMFWLAPYAAAGDEYFFEDVVLEKVLP